MRLSILLLPFFFLQLLQAQPLQVVNPVSDYKNNPVGVHASPRFSWQLSSAKNDVIQTAYELKVAADIPSLSKTQNLIWQSGKVSSDQSQHISYGGPALKSRQRYYWQVRVWDNQKNASAW